MEQYFVWRVFIVVFSVSHDQMTGNDGEQISVLLSYCLLNLCLLVLWWAISCSKMSRWINECEYYSKNIDSKKVEVKPHQFSIGSSQALPIHQRAVFKLTCNMTAIIMLLRWYVAKILETGFPWPSILENNKFIVHIFKKTPHWQFQIILDCLIVDKYSCKQSVTLNQKIIFKTNKSYFQ